MKQIAITGERACAVLDKEEPSIMGNFIKVKILAVPCVRITRATCTNEGVPSCA